MRRTSTVPVSSSSRNSAECPRPRGTRRATRRRGRARWPRWSRSAPSTRCHHRACSSATKSSVWPGGRHASSCSSPTGTWRSASSTSPRLVEDEIRETLRAPRLRLRPRALQLSRARTPWERRCSARSARSRRRRTRSPRVTSVASWISSPKRRSGLSIPYRSIASAYVMRAKRPCRRAGRRCTRARRDDDRSINFEDVLAVGNASSRSSCVNSWTPVGAQDPRPGSSVAIW